MPEGCNTCICSFRLVLSAGTARKKEVTLGCLHVLKTTKGYFIDILISNIIG